MNCPTCLTPTYRLSGGYKHVGSATRIAYWECRNDDCETVKISVSGGVVKIMTDEPGQTFKSTREALRVVRLAARDDLEWFDGISEETEALARVVVGMLR